MIAEERCTQPMFLSDEWIANVVRTIEDAKAADQNLSSLVRGFSLSVAAIVSGLPEELRKRYGGQQATIFMELRDGKLQEIVVGSSLPASKTPDFTVKSDYEVVKRILSEQLKPSSAFLMRKIKVEPLMKIYADPAFTAKSIVTANALARLITSVPTAFPG